jgi:hypothetical protein
MGVAVLEGDVHRQIDIAPATDCDLPCPSYVFPGTGEAWSPDKRLAAFSGKIGLFVIWLLFEHRLEKRCGQDATQGDNKSVQTARCGPSKARLPGQCSIAARFFALQQRNLPKNTALLRC